MTRGTAPALVAALSTVVAAQTPVQPDAPPVRERLLATAAPTRERALTPQVLEAVMLVAEDIDPLLARRLAAVKAGNPDRFEATVRRIGGRLILMAELRLRDRELYELKVSEQAANTEVAGIVRRLRSAHAAGEPERPLRQALRRGVTEQVALSVKARVQYFNRLEQLVTDRRAEIESDVMRFPATVKERMAQLTERARVSERVRAAAAPLASRRPAPAPAEAPAVAGADPFGEPGERCDELEEYARYALERAMDPLVSGRERAGRRQASLRRTSSPPPSPGVLAEVLPVAQDIDPIVAARLRAVRARQPEQYQATVVRIAEHLIPLAELRLHDQRLYVIMATELQLETRVRRKVEELEEARRAGSPEADRLKVQLEDLVRQQVALSFRARVEYLRRLEAHVDHVRGEIESEASRFVDTVNAQIERLLAANGLPAYETLAGRE